jgi:cyclomaltodextrinase / maltogenic alpha-amylase / neopullulanase
MSASWARESIFYHIYPLGLCGAEPRNDFTSAPNSRLDQIRGWIEHLHRMGVNAMYLGPVFESSAHGYDTADYYHVDRRLGTDETLAGLIGTLHAEGIRVLLDGVFHHVGRDFWAFRDLREKGSGSSYRDWFAGVDFNRRSPYDDVFAYDGWQGHFDLVKLNLGHPDVRAHLFGAVRSWVERFGIDGLRLDVADALDPGFLRELAAFCRGLRSDFWLLGEAIHGDYRRLTAPGLLDSATNYECYKGLYSSHNDRNYFEIASSLNRQFGDGGLYRDVPLYNFADNHDVSRVASTVKNPAHLYPLHLLLFTMPGVPSIYAGSEWGLEGVRTAGDDRPLRPALTVVEASSRGAHPDLAGAIARFAAIRHSTPALRHGSYRQLFVASEQLAFSLRTDGEHVVVAVNAAAAPARLEFALPERDGASFIDLLDPGWRAGVAGGRVCLDGVPACWGRILARQ